MERNRDLKFYLSHVDEDGPFLKLTGHLNLHIGCLIERLFSRENFESGIGAVPSAAIFKGLVCAAKSRNGSYRRAEVYSTNHLSMGLVGVYYIDYGYHEITSVSTLRLLEAYNPILLEPPSQAIHFYLGSIIRPSAGWDKNLVMKMQSHLCSSYYFITVEATTLTLPIISLKQLGKDLSTHLVANNMGVRVTVTRQQKIIQMLLTNEHAPSMATNRPSKSYCSTNNSRLQQIMSVPYNGGFVPKPSVMSQRLLARDNSEPKPSTSFHKDASEAYSSVKGNILDDSRKKDCSEDFGQRGSSFCGRENRDDLYRSGTGRYSDNSGGKPDRPKIGDRENRDDLYRSGTGRYSDNIGVKPDRPKIGDRENRDDLYRSGTGRYSDNIGGKPDRPKIGNRSDGGVGGRLNPREYNAPISASEYRDCTPTHAQSSLRYNRDPDNKFKNQHGWTKKNNCDWGNNGRPSREKLGRDFGGYMCDSRGNKKENYKKRHLREKRGYRSERTYISPRYRPYRAFGYQNGRFSRIFRRRSLITQNNKLPNPVPFETPFAEPCVNLNAQYIVSVPYVTSPDSFYVQIVSRHLKLLEMMHKIPEIYKGVKPYTGVVPDGSSVLVRYPKSDVLCRATTLMYNKPFQNYVVQMIDFGKKIVVDRYNIWQLDKQLMELPKAIHCSLLGVAPKDREWKANNEVDQCFQELRYQCVFQERVEDKYMVSLSNNGASVADLLIEKQLALASDLGSSVTLKDETIDLPGISSDRSKTVESSEELNVQQDLNKVVVCNEDTNLLNPLVADILAGGIHCTVRLNENTICRAILNDVSDASNIKAVLPDYGMSIITALNKVMILPKELSVCCYQALDCPNNHTEASKTVQSPKELKLWIIDKKLFANTNYLDGIRPVTNENETGQNSAISKPVGTPGEVVQLHTRAIFDYNFGLAHISHIESLNEIYLQKVADRDRIAALLDEMRQFYEKGSPEKLTNFGAHAICAAHSSDGNWRRATVISVSETECKLHYLDEGNTETIAKESLMSLDIKFYEPCALALMAGLDLVALQDDAISKLQEWIEEKEVQVSLSFSSDRWLSRLLLDGVDLSIKLVNEKLATPQTENNKEVTAEAPAEKPLSLPAGCIQAYISYADSPSQFWLQMSDKIDAIKEIQAELQAKAGNYADVETREIGTLCIAKYLADNQWRRVEILDFDSDITVIRFIDYGNSDALDNQPGLLKVIPDNLKVTEGFAVKCSMNAVPTGTGQWSEPASDYFTQLVGDLSAPVDVMIMLKDVTTYVNIFVNGQNVIDKLISEGHATRSEETKCGGDLPSCFVSHVNSPSEFWIRLETATAELQSIVAAMVDGDTFPELAKKKEGVFCAAKCPEDGAWYRAMIIVDDFENTEVLFVDYGNVSIATKLRSLPDDLKVKSALSRKCALQNPRDIKSWSQQSEVKFNELCAKRATIFNVEFIASGEISVVELYLQGKCVTEELVGLCEKKPLSETPTLVGQDLQSTGKICRSKSF